MKKIKVVGVPPKKVEILDKPKEKVGHQEFTEVYQAGTDYFTPPPDLVKVAFCGICNEEMEVKRNVNGPTGWAESVGGMKHLHDTFSCKHRTEDWHCQVRNLKSRITKETSKKITDMLTEEMNEVLKSKKPTKDINWQYIHLGI